MAGRIDGASILGSPKTANYALFSVKHWKACEVRVQVLREMYGVMIEEPPPNFPLNYVQIVTLNRSCVSRKKV